MPKLSMLRQSLQDKDGLKVGTVLILLAGRFRGRRVVLLARDPKGALIVSGPYKVNGVPLRRVDPAYVIATSTRFDLKSVDVSAIGADFFARPKKASKKSEEAFFKKGEKAEKTELPEDKKKVQTAVDEQILKAISKDENNVKYLASVFTLRDRDLPHAMKF